MEGDMDARCEKSPSIYPSWKLIHVGLYADTMRGGRRTLSMRNVKCECSIQGNIEWEDLGFWFASRVLGAIMPGEFAFVELDD